ncbi:TonB-dependent receptor domain-containing protein [Sphingomonas sp. MMS12-HWE2-04]|uniref:TonB-dependent receptor domain-containing protein n=1 Tax=Sphingomonas sp. MMS12-HWE2-04 TaxID=3234199 RepID=UPI00384F0C0E
MLAGIALASVVIAAPATAQSAARQDFHIEAQDLGDALRLLSHQSGKEIVFDAGLVAGKRSSALRGHYTPAEAVRQLLMGTGLETQIAAGGFLIRGREQAAGPLSNDTAADGQILVTGSRIAAGTIASPVIVLDQKELRTAGYTNLGDVIRALPQNFGGGQNPTVVSSSQGANNQNTTSSSTFNLRGLGADATLSLLNGHRMPYDGVTQGVDVSSIPLATIDRIEVVTDGASAIYGSDAVAGVANVLLKRSFKGLETSLLVGGSTDGGNQQVRASAVAGSEWSTGGIMGAVDYSRQTQILAGQRDYASTMQAEQTVLPRLRQVSGIVSGYQDLGTSVRFEIDATYNRRKSRTQTPSSSAANYLQAGALVRFDVETYSISPSLHMDIAPGWQGYAMGTYAQSKADILSQIFASNTVTTTVPVTYTNILKTGELGVSGEIFSLPGGPLKLAAGGGYRSSVLDALSRTITPSAQLTQLDFTKDIDSWYAFGELNAPMVGPSSGIPFVHRLVASAAGRYERYSGIGDIFTPKLGLVYSPVAALDLSLSWGRSFKVPTMYQQFLGKTVLLRAATAYGTSQFPAGSTVLGLSGGNSESLTPERAENLTTSATFRPAFLEGGILQVSYYHVRYRDRVIAPIPSNLGLFANPLYAPFVTLAPTANQIAAALADATGGLQIVSGGPFDPSRVVAIVDNRQHNSSRQDIQGVDMTARYPFALGDGRVELLGNAAYLRSKQVLLAGQTAVDLAGMIYNPSTWRARGGVRFDQGGLSVSSYVNYLSGNRDRRILPERAVASFTTWDLAITYRVEADGSLLDGLEVALSGSNILDQAPGRIRQGNTIEPTYDSTNGSAIGRFLSLTVRKQW